MEQWRWGLLPQPPPQPPHSGAQGRHGAYPALPREIPPPARRQQAGLRWAAALAVGCVPSQTQSTAPARETTALCVPRTALCTNSTIRTKHVVCRTPTFCALPPMHLTALSFAAEKGLHLRTNAWLLLHACASIPITHAELSKLYRTKRLGYNQTGWKSPRERAREREMVLF